MWVFGGSTHPWLSFHSWKRVPRWFWESMTARLRSLEMPQRTRSGRCWLKSKPGLARVGSCSCGHQHSCFLFFLTGVVLGSHTGELTRRAHHRPAQPLTLPCHRHRLQLLGVCRAFQMPLGLPDEPPQEVRGLVMGGCWDPAVPSSASGRIFPIPLRGSDHLVQRAAQLSAERHPRYHLIDPL